MFNSSSRSESRVIQFVPGTGEIDAPVGELEAAQLEVLYPQRHAAVVVLHGEHDLNTKESLRKTLTALLDMRRTVVADVSVAKFVDSSTLGELVRAHHKAANEGTNFRLQFGTEPIVRQVFEITGLLSILEWYPTRDEALEGRRQVMKQPDRLL